jgi:predicted  nucleic acid-binding Zn-ribbon protein
MNIFDERLPLPQRIKKCEIEISSLEIKVEVKRETIEKFQKANARHLQELAEIEQLLPQLEALLSKGPDEAVAQLLADRITKLQWKKNAIQKRAKLYTPEAHAKMEKQIQYWTDVIHFTRSMKANLEERLAKEKGQ